MLRFMPEDGTAAREGLLIDSAQAAELVKPYNSVAVGGSGSLLQVPETLLKALGERFVQTQQPHGLDVIHVMGLGDHEGRGIDHLVKDGLTRRFVGSHFVLSPHQQRAIAENKVEAVGLPAGTISLLYREIAAGRPGLFTDIGLGTFVDPRQASGRMNACTSEGLSEVKEINGAQWLFYPSFPIDVALLRGTECDPAGNISMDDEAAFSDNLAIAQAVHNSGGIVLVEIKRMVQAGTIPAGRVKIPGPLVDHVVMTDWPNQTPWTLKDPRRTGVNASGSTEVAPLPLDQRKVIARRAAQELHAGDLANLGVGMANGISYVALEEEFLNTFTLTVEQGLFGGLPGFGLDSGTAINPSAIVDMTSQFDLYNGGGLDFAGLSFAQIDARGNVNVTAVGSTPIGPGGFIDISQKAGTLVFCGTLRGGGLSVKVGNGDLQILQEGRYEKFVNSVEHITFNAERALSRGQRVLYITERAVFELTEAGVALTEIAPGVDLEHDVLQQMSFLPVMEQPPQTMDPRLFRLERVGIRPRAGRNRGLKRNKERSFP